MDTSKAEIGSSQNRNSGFTDNALAIPILWRCPPENSWTPSDELYGKPYHPYTEALLSAVPIADPDASEKRKRILLLGDIPSPPQGSQDT